MGAIRKRRRREAEIAFGLESTVHHWDVHGFGLWLLRDRVTGAMVGRGGIENTLATGEIEIEVAWAIVPDRWGQGLATELAHAAVDAAARVGLLELIALTLPHNVASRRVMDKAGFRYERDILHVGLPHVLYRRRLIDPAPGVCRGAPVALRPRAWVSNGIGIS